MVELDRRRDVGLAASRHLSNLEGRGTEINRASAKEHKSAQGERKRTGELVLGVVDPSSVRCGSRVPLPWKF